VTVQNPALGERFSLRIRKSHFNNPALKWHNTYEFRSNTVTDLPDLLTACENIVDFEEALHNPIVVFESFTVSTYVPDGQPYNPDSFVTIPIGSVGENDTGLGELAPLHLCWRVAFRPTTGRLGFRLYRGCLKESQFNSPAGVPVISALGEVEAVLTGALTNINLYLSGNEGAIYLSMESNLNSRYIEEVQSAGITMKKLNNRYFDVPPP
jgi:hypothetical protein